MFHRLLKLNRSPNFSPNDLPHPQCSPSLLSKWHHNRPVIQAKHLEQPLIPPLVHSTSNPPVSSVQNVCLSFNFPTKSSHSDLLFDWSPLLSPEHDYRSQLSFIFTCFIIAFFPPVFPTRLQMILDYVYWVYNIQQRSGN